MKHIKCEIMYGNGGELDKYQTEYFDNEEIFRKYLSKQALENSVLVVKNTVWVEKGT